LLVSASTPAQNKDTVTDARGSFSISVSPGRYTVEVSASGYASTSAGPIDATDGTRIDVALEPLDSPHLRLIGQVTVNGALAVSRNAIPSIDISRDAFERSGYDRVIDGLTEIPSVTFARPNGGASSAPAVVALRGPDPSETLIVLDGQLLNDGNTGDLDLSQFPVAAFSSVDVTEGLGPSDSEGSNTIGGAIDLLSLRPTQLLHAAFSLSAGSFGASEGWYNATGSRGKFGYAFAVADRQEGGFVNQDVQLCAPGDSTTCAPAHLGSTVSSRAALANVAWNFSDKSDIALRIFALGNQRDLSSAINGIDNSTDPLAPNSTFGMFIGPGNAVFGQNIRSYQLRARTPVGAGSLTSTVSFSNNTTDLTGNGTGTGSGPYDVSHQDKRNTVGMTWGRTFERSDFSFGGYVQRETMTELNVNGALAQNIDSYFVRGSTMATDKLRLSAGAYLSNYTSFGSNLDGRIGASYDLSPSSAVRFSVGTGFRAPLLIERYVFPDGPLGTLPPGLPPPDANCVIAGQGNADEKPEHATEYELGYSQVYASQANLDVSLYRTNLRDPIENFYPLGDHCPAMSPFAFSFPINVGNAVYQGAEVRFRQRFPKQHLFMTLQYGLNAAYPQNFKSDISNPTSGGNLVNGAQFLGIPQQVGSIAFDWDDNAWHAAIDTTFRGNNNELHQGPFTLMNAGVGKRFGNLDVTLAGTNLLNNATSRYTVFGGGVPYRGVVGLDPANGPLYGPLPTDRYGVEPLGARLIFTIRR